MPFPLRRHGTQTSPNLVHSIIKRAERNNQSWSMAMMENSNTRRRQRVAGEPRQGGFQISVEQGTKVGIAGQVRKGRTRRVEVNAAMSTRVSVRRHVGGRRIALRNRTDSAKNAGAAGSPGVLNWRRCATTTLRAARGEMACTSAAAAVFSSTAAQRRTCVMGEACTTTHWATWPKLCRQPLPAHHLSQNTPLA